MHTTSVATVSVSKVTWKEERATALHSVHTLFDWLTDLFCVVENTKPLQHFIIYNLTLVIMLIYCYCWRGVWKGNGRNWFHWYVFLHTKWPNIPDQTWLTWPWRVLPAKRTSARSTCAAWSPLRLWPTTVRCLSTSSCSFASKVRSMREVSAFDLYTWAQLRP